MLMAYAYALVKFRRQGLKLESAYMLRQILWRACQQFLNCSILDYGLVVSQVRLGYNDVLKLANKFG